MNESGVITFIGGVVGGVIGYFTPIGPYGGYLIGTALGAVIEGAVRKDPEDQVFTQESFVDLKISSSALGNPIPRIYGINRVAGKFIWASPKIPVLHRERDPSEIQGSKLKGGAGPDSVTVFKTYVQHFALGLCEGPVLRVTRMWMDETLVFDVAQPSRFTLYTADASGLSAESDTMPVLAKGADHRHSAQSGVLFTGTEEQLPSAFVEQFEGAGNVPAYRGLAWMLLRNIDIGAMGRVPNFTFEVVESTQSLGRPVALKGISLGVWTAWKTEVAEGVEGYGSGDLIFYNVNGVTPTIYMLTGGRGTNSMDVLDMYGIVSNGLDESVYIFDSLSGKHIVGPVPMNPADLPSTGVVRGNKTILEHQTVFASSRTITRNEGSYVDDGIVYGSRIQLTGSQVGNDETYTVENVVALELTVFEPLVADEEAESFLMTVLGKGGTVGLTQAVFGKSYGGDYEDKSHTIAAICATTQDLRFFQVGTGVPGITRLALGATPSIIVFNVARSVTGSLAQFYIACETEGVVKRVDSTGPTSLSLAETITFTAAMHTGEAMIIAANLFVYVTESQTDSVWKFQTDVDKVQITTNIGASPQALQEASDGYVWVANFGEQSVSRIDPTTNVAQKFTLPIVPTVMTLGAAGSVWVASESESLVLRVDTAGTVLATVKVPRFPTGLSPDEQGNIWVMCDVAKTVAMITWDGSRVSLPEIGNGLACVVREECERVGVLPEEIDVSGLDVQPVSITIATITSARTILEQLAQAYQFTGIESGFSLRFAFKSDAFNAGLVKQVFLGATANAEPPQSTMSLVRHDELETPTSVIVTAESRQRSYNPDSQSHKISAFRPGIHNIVKLDFPLVLDRYEMKRIAQNLLFELLSQRQSYRMSLPPRYLLLEPFDTVSIESTIDADYFHVGRMTEVTLGNNLDLEVTAADYVRHVYQEFRSVPSVSLPSIRTIPEIGITGADYIEPPFLIGAEVFLDSPRIFIALYAVQGVFSDSVAFESRNEEESYEFVLSSVYPAITGAVTGIVPTGPLNVWDDTTSIEVTLDSSDTSLSMVSDIHALNRANAAMVGGELLYFTTPTLVAPNVYQLTRLLRGRLGTEEQVSLHVSGERFVLLDNYAQENLAAVYPLSRVGIQSYFKTFPTVELIAEADPETHTPSGRSIQPWAPLIVSLVQNVDGDWTVTWLHRSRSEAGDWNNYAGISYDPDDTGRYTLRLYGGNVPADEVSLEFASGPWASAEETRTWTYLIADQIADGYEWDTLDVGICTLSTRMEGLEARSSSNVFDAAIFGGPPGGGGGASAFGAGTRAITNLRRW